MAAKLLHLLADDNSDLQKQIGCVTGIFPPPSSGDRNFRNGSRDVDSNYPHNGANTERKPKKYVNEKQRGSMESSRPSLSSSSCSSPSSTLNCGRTGKAEIPSRDSIVCETNARLEMGRMSVDLREVVKDSMYKDSWGISVEAKIKGKGKKDMPNVVVKLMGLDIMPTTTRPPGETHLGPSGSRKEPTSTHPKNRDEVMKPICSSKFPIEAAPWKHMDSFRGSRKFSTYSLSDSRGFGKIERRFEELEESEKDIRALKQILEAMQVKGFIEDAKTELYMWLESMTDDDHTFGFNTNPRMNSKESPIVVMKPANFYGLRRPESGEFGAHRNNSASSKMSKDHTVRESGEEQATTSNSDGKTNNRHFQVAQTSTRVRRQESRDKNPNLLQNSGSITRRVQPKKPEKATPLSDSNKSKTQPYAPSIRSGSLGGRRGSLLCQEDMRSKLSEEDEVGNVCIAPEQPSPVSVLDSSVYAEETTSPVRKISHTLEDAGHAASESNENCVQDAWNTSGDNLSTETTVLELPSKIIRKKLQRIENLVQKLRQLNSSHDESQTDYIASLCENSNPDNRYICEVLITSGFLLRDLSNFGLTVFELHPSGHPINPELFLVLEQTKTENSANGVALTEPKPRNLHRKVIFDVVNEILLQILNSVSPPNEPWFKPDKLAKKTLNAQMLLKEVCGEIELLQGKNKSLSLLEEEDMMKKSDKWMDFRCDISKIILDVERSIFRELVNEIILGEGAFIRGRANGCSRRLFSK